MKPGYAAPDALSHHNNSQQILQNDDNFSSVFPIQNPPPNLNHPFQSHLPPHQKQSALMHQNQPHFRPPFHRQEEAFQPPFLPVKFKFGLHQNQQTFPSWHTQQDSSSIKEPFWKQLSRSNNNNNNNKPQSENEEQVHIEAIRSKYCKPVNAQQIDEANDKYRLFGELEAIYSLARVCETNQTGSGSALTGENSLGNACPSMPFRAVDNQNPGTINGSENSIGEEAASLSKSQKRTRKRKLKENLSFMAGFLEMLVKQVMDHQEMLHRKFLQVIDRMDKERTEREEEWRRQESEKYNREAITRAHEQSLASSREAQIISCIEKITGQTIDLPARKTCFPEIKQIPTKELTPTKPDNHSRWPKAEVEALIQVRSSIETKFQEPGLKAPLWEEVSSLMGSMGYQRSAKRCKEKWENINKYFKKAKESTKKRSQQSKTCSYFNHLDQLYSRSSTNPPSSSNISSVRTDHIELENHGYSEIFEALIADSTHPYLENKKIAELSPSKLEFDGDTNDHQEKEDHEDEYEMDSYDEDEEGSDEEI